MTPRQPVVSGAQLVKALEKDGWTVVRQRGSHVRLKKPGRRMALVVPVHRELRKGTLAGILRDADLDADGQMLGNDLKAVDGASEGAWIEPALGGGDGAVTEQVPKLFEAYARVFHPPSDDQGNAVTWAEVARRLGRTAHPEMQWHQIVGTADTFGIEGSSWSGNIPRLGEMGIEELDRLCEVLGEQTADSEHCYFGLCEINHHPLVRAIEGEQGKQSRLGLPLGRDHLVLAGPLIAVVQFGADPLWREAPSLIWPADRSWFVASEVDFDSTLVGGSRALVDALVAAPGLEVHEVQPETKLTAFSDKLNPVGEP
ncbi:MAG TPA: type II toxin-antitoxin system HicA family toxin [Solirubrobacterales bacterium]|nr:type II toxin-antitoxin system HicA family toxin [Solirubrobacterales bacterium]